MSSCEPVIQLRAITQATRPCGPDPAPGRVGRKGPCASKKPTKSVVIHKVGSIGVALEASAPGWVPYDLREILFGQTVADIESTRL